MDGDGAAPWSWYDENDACKYQQSIHQQSTMFAVTLALSLALLMALSLALAFAVLSALVLILLLAVVLELLLALSLALTLAMMLAYEASAKMASRWKTLALCGRGGDRSHIEGRHIRSQSSSGQDHACARPVARRSFGMSNRA